MHYKPKVITTLNCSVLFLVDSAKENQHTTFFVSLLICKQKETCIYLKAAKQLLLISHPVTRSV